MPYHGKLGSTGLFAVRLMTAFILYNTTGGEESVVAAGRRTLMQKERETIKTPR